MAIKIVPHGAHQKEAVHAFNIRMREGGSRYGFYEDPVPDWIPKKPGQPVWREYWLAVDENDCVRGGYALKPQQWLIQGRPQTVTDWQGPFSEGAFDNRFNTLGLRMVRDMLKKRPLLYSLGHGADEEPMVQMLKKMGWLMHDTPFCLRVYKPFRFLRYNGYLRQRPVHRALLDIGAYSGVGPIGIKALHIALRIRSMHSFSSHAEEVPKFGAWTDKLWAECKDYYSAIAVRDAESMNTLVPEVGWPHGIRLCIGLGARKIGWALVLDTPMAGDQRFGTLRVGSIIDTLSMPEHAGQVVAAASSFLQKRGVDIVVSNQSHPAWIEGFRDNGYLVLEAKRIFAASPQLSAVLSPFEEVSQGLHLTNMDGHGPMLL